MDTQLRDSFDLICISLFLILLLVIFLYKSNRDIAKEAWYSYWYPIVWISRIFKTRPNIKTPRSNDEIK